MAEENQNDSTQKGNVKVRPNAVVHLDRDPNDPRRNVATEANLSKLNEEDPETEPKFQNPVE